MKNFWEKYRLGLSIIIYLSLMTASFLFIVNPLLADIREKSDEIQKIEIDNQISQERIAKLPEMQERHAIFEQEKNNLNVILDQNNSVDFIRRLELLAQETGNKISLKIDDSSAASKSGSDSKAKKEKKDAENIASNLPSEKYISMEIVLEGKYENFIQFLYKLGNLDYYVNVLSLSLIKEEIDQSAGDAGLKSKKEEATSTKDILVSSIKIIVYIK